MAIDNAVYQVSWRMDCFDEIHKQFFDDMDEAYEFIHELRDIDNAFFIDYKVL